MTGEEVRQKMKDARLKAFMEALYLARGDVEPKVCGYKTLEDALKQIIIHGDKKAEAILVEWEKANEN